MIPRLPPLSQTLPPCTSLARAGADVGKKILVLLSPCTRDRHLALRSLTRERASRTSGVVLVHGVVVP
jgi:hypothetical protein